MLPSHADIKCNACFSLLLLFSLISCLEVVCFSVLRHVFSRWITKGFWTCVSSKVFSDQKKKNYLIYALMASGKIFHMQFLGTSIIILQFYLCCSLLWLDFNMKLNKMSNLSCFFFHLYASIIFVVLLIL